MNGIMVVNPLGWCWWTASASSERLHGFSTSTNASAHAPAQPRNTAL